MTAHGNPRTVDCRHGGRFGGRRGELRVGFEESDRDRGREMQHGEDPGDALQADRAQGDGDDGGSGEGARAGSEIGT